MKKITAIFWTVVLMFSLVACSVNTEQEETRSSQSSPQTEQVSPEAVPEDNETGSASVDAAGDTNILIAYFTRLDNTEGSLEEIILGGGPYGSLGDSLEDADVDAIASASITLTVGQTQGNVETMAQMIAAATGGQLFSIQTAQSYPADYDELIDLGGEEKSREYRPELTTHVEHMDVYDVIFLGYPNWWHDMPMALYSFLEEYDLSGKTIIPFAASAGSGFSNTISAIQSAQPDATVVEDGLHIPMGEVGQSEERVRAWIGELNLVSE